MPFDPQQFEAEVALRIIPTETLPGMAQDAMEAGYDGPAVVRMAILDPKHGWAIDQALSGMLSELCLSFIDLRTAALRLARIRAERILSAAEEDPLESISYFYKLMLAADYPNELVELAYLDDQFYLMEDDPTEQRTMALDALENLLYPGLGEKKSLARQAAWKLRQQEAEVDWPYVFNSPGGRTLLHQRVREQLDYIRPIFTIEVVAWAIAGWAFDSWRVGVIGFLVSMPLFPLMAYLGSYRQLKLERRNLLLRQGYPEEKI